MKKIMFNDRYGLTQAVLEGRKTMTRRVINAKAEKWERFKHGDKTSDWDYPYQIIEKIAIAQRYRDVFNDPYHISLYGRTAGWNNKMFVNAAEMPHHIEMLNYHVEHLQDISDEDCMKEGVLSSDKYAMPYGIPDKDGSVSFYYSAPREAFATLIDKVSGKATWDSNPLVWVYEFKLID